MLVSLINTPKNDQDWETWLWAHRDSHDRIRLSIQSQTGALTGITITNGGSGYTSIPSIEINGGNGHGAQIQVTIQGGVITELEVISGGLQYVNPVIMISGGGGSGATATATAAPDINLTDYVIYPVDSNHLKDFLENNQSLHSDMNAILGLQSSNLQDVDFSVENQKTAWFYSHYLEHQSAEQKLGI